MTHTCNCGTTFEVEGGWNNYGKTLRCPECEEARTELVEQIHSVMENVQVDEVRISLSVRHLVEMGDFPGDVEVSFVRANRIAGSDYEVIGRWM